VATKIALLLRRRSTLILAVAVLAAVIGSAFGHVSPMGMWDGPL
jgi:hypothetical protein